MVWTRNNMFKKREKNSIPINADSFYIQRTKSWRKQLRWLIKKGAKIIIIFQYSISCRFLIVVDSS